MPALLLGNALGRPVRSGDGTAIVLLLNPCACGRNMPVDVGTHGIVRAYIASRCRKRR
jgi:hypothetical protein